MSAVLTRQSSLVEGEFLLTMEDFHVIAAILLAESGIVLNEAKATLLYSRLGKRLRALGMTEFRQYCDLVRDPAEQERGRMVRSLTTNVTRFFREPHHFQHLRDVVLPPLLRAAQDGAPVRLWSAACSTGEEPYSLALTVLQLLPDAGRFDIRVLATDIDTNVLTQAREGRYGAEALAAVPPGLRSRWFDGAGDGFAAGAALRQLIAFRPLNLIGPWPMRGSFDVIMCRNVVIYFSEATQMEVWQRFSPLLAVNGFLYIGHSERLCGPAAAGFASAGITTYRRIAS